MPNAVTELVRVLESNPEVCVTYCDYFPIDADGKSLRLIETEEFNKQRLVADLVCQPGAGALFSRKLYDTLGGWNEQLLQVPDIEFWLRAAEFGEFRRLNSALAKYWVNNESASFRLVSIERRTEIERVMDSYWLQRGGLNLKLDGAPDRGREYVWPEIIFNQAII